MALSTNTGSTVPKHMIQIAAGADGETQITTPMPLTTAQITGILQLLSASYALVPNIRSVGWDEGLGGVFIVTKDPASPV